MPSSLATVLARARVIATEMGAEPNTSPLIDNLAGFRALLNHVIQDVWRKKANNPKGYHDISTRQTVAVASGVGGIPSNIMREFLNGNAQFQDANGSLITFFPYAVDYSSGTTYTQLGYVTIQGDDFLYRAPAPNQTYTGNLYVTALTMPTIPSSWSGTLDVTEVALNDIILSLALAVKGQYSFDGITDPSDGK